jgi:hypothetical protein
LTPWHPQVLSAKDTKSCGLRLLAILRVSARI